jgi:[ribosomal protein S5]-alanine N-acetyltransferase
MSELVLTGAICRLRPYRSSDVDALCAAADDPCVARWMTAAFPHPYTRTDAEGWIVVATSDDAVRQFAIEADGAFAGGIGFQPLGGEHRGVALFGYWLARRVWGRGIATEAARLLAAYALQRAGIRRLEATVFAPNTGSARVLEKAGFRLEARHRVRCVERDGTICDGLLYARLASDPELPQG